MRKKALLFSFFILYSCFGSILYAQKQDTSTFNVLSDSGSKSKPLLWWLSFGYGGSTVTDGEIGAGVGALLTVEYGAHFFSARIIHDQGVREDVYPKQLIFDTGLLYGIGFHRELWFGYASAGLAYTATTKRVFDYIDSSYTHAGSKVEIDKAELYRGIGFAWQAQLFSKFSDSSKGGLGLTIFGNINTPLSFWGFLLSLELGVFQ